MRVSSWRERHNDRSRRAFLTDYGARLTYARAKQIHALPSKLWKGQRVYPLTCNADFGRGPHMQFVPEGLLWALIDLRAWRCPFHAS